MAPERAADEPSRAEVQRRIHSLYDRAETDSGTFNATRAVAAGTRSRVSPTANRERRQADPALDGIAKEWFAAARASLGPTVPAALPTDRMPQSPAVTRSALPVGRPGDVLQDRARELAERRLPELTAGPTGGAPTRPLELTAGPVAALPAASQTRPVEELTPRAALPAPAAKPSSTPLRGSKETYQKKLAAARELLAGHAAQHTGSLPAIASLPAETEAETDWAPTPAPAIAAAVAPPALEAPLDAWPSAATDAFIATGTFAALDTFEATGALPVVGTYVSTFGTDDFGTGDFGTGDFRADGFGTGGFAAGGFGTGDFRTDGFGTGDFRTDGFAAGGFAAGGLGGTGDFRTDGFGTGDFRADGLGTGGFAAGDFRPDGLGTGDFRTASFAGTTDGGYGTGALTDTGAFSGMDPYPGALTGGIVPDPAPVYDSKASQALAFAREQIGRPCVWGAAGPGSYDASGLAQTAWKAAGVVLPRTAEDQAATGTPVPLTDLQPGDLVFFYDTAGHVGVYTGNAMMIHAPNPGATIREESIFFAGSTVIHSATRPA